jgi:hypothetical protein
MLRGTKECGLAKKVSVEAVFLLQLGVGLFLATLGIAGLTHWGSGLSEIGRRVTRFFGGRNDVTALVVAITELAAGVVVVGALLVPGKTRLPYVLTVVVTLLWLAYAVVTTVRSAFEPDLVSWLNQLAADLVVLVALWVVSRRYA